MLLFLASVLEQLDVALEHLGKNDVHNARFSLMLTDNIVELILHQIAKDRQSSLSWNHPRDSYPHARALEKALRRSFEEKVKFARLESKLTDEEAQTFSILHGYRNEVYHVGLQHEAILKQLAAFCFHVACEFASRYSPNGLYWGSGTQLPERSKKYFTGDERYFPGRPEDFKAGCEALKRALSFKPQALVTSLANHADEVIADQDVCLDVIAGGVYDNQKTTRECALIQSQAWKVAFSEEGKEFGRANGFPGGSMFTFVEWMATNYPFQFRKDPIQSWQVGAEALRAERNPHKALNRYHSFMEATADIRETLMDSAGAVEQEIDALIDRARGK
jgi:hypothetical protein